MTWIPILKNARSKSNGLQAARCPKKRTPVQNDQNLIRRPIFQFVLRLADLGKTNFSRHR